MVLGVPTPLTREGPPYLFFDHFFDIVFDPLLDRFWSQLGPHLASKIDQKSVQELSKSHSKLDPVFGTLLDRFVVDFCSIFEPKTIPKSAKKESKQ